HGVRIRVAAAEDRLVRTAPEPYDLAARERQLGRGVLFHEGQDAGAGAAGEREQVDAVVQHETGLGALDAGDGAQQGRLAGAVRADDGRERTGRGVERYVIH